MTRTAALLTGLAAVLLVVVFWFLLYSPQNDEIAELDSQRTAAVDQQTQIRTQIAALEDVRAQIPEVEAALAAASSIVPESASLPATLRQLQQAADDSGVVLTSVSPSRPVEPTPLDETVVLPAELAEIPLSVNVSGGYFQVVDFLRRVEDPTIIARGIIWGTLDATVGEEYPTLEVLLTGSMFARLDPVAVEGAAPAPTETGTPTDGETDVDVDVDVTVTETPAAAAPVEVAS